MTVAAVFTFPKEEIERYDRDLEQHGDLLRNQPARRFHICFETPDNYTVVDVWDNLEAFEKFGDLVTGLARDLSDEPPGHSPTLWVELHRVHNVIERSQK